MNDYSKIEISELAAIVSVHLENNGISAVLSGGACVSIYTENTYQSYDLDFIPYNTIDHEKLDRVMTEISFYRENRYYKNSTTQFFIEFPAPPPVIGQEIVHTSDGINIEGKVIKMLSPTDSVRDRLSAFYFWNDLQGLEQAIMIFQKQDVDLDKVKRWSEKEGMESKYQEFFKRISEIKK